MVMTYYLILALITPPPRNSSPASLISTFAKHKKMRTALLNEKTTKVNSKKALTVFKDYCVSWAP